MDKATQGQVVLDQKQTLQSVTGSLAAYYDFENDKKVNKHILPDPQDFTLLTRFTGWDGFLFKWGTEERYGLIYQSTVQPDTYMVAFRGTDSDMDAWEDIEQPAAEIQEGWKVQCVSYQEEERPGKGPYGQGREVQPEGPYQANVRTVARQALLHAAEWRAEDWPKGELVSSRKCG